MTIFNLGSINTDHFYRLAHFPAPGETLAASSYARGLGGKGANQSVAAARAGAEVRHIGAIGPEGGWMIARLSGLGVDCRHVATVETVSGHAIINLDARGENSIVIVPGANRAIPADLPKAALKGAGPGDVLILQNETGLQAETARFAQEQGLFVVYSAAPFEADAVRAVLPFLSLLLLNEVEAAQLTAALGLALPDLPVPAICVTRGAKGAVWHDLRARTRTEAPIFAVEAVDTTGAGDTFAGYLVAGLAQGLGPAAALHLAAAAAALKVTRHGAAEAVPSLAETKAFLQE